LLNSGQRSPSRTHVAHGQHGHAVASGLGSASLTGVTVLTVCHEGCCATWRRLNEMLRFHFIIRSCLSGCLWPSSPNQHHKPYMPVGSESPTGP
jgi:hypothetical protein